MRIYLLPFWLLNWIYILLFLAWILVRIRILLFLNIFLFINKLIILFFKFLIRIVYYFLFLADLIFIFFGDFLALGFIFYSVTFEQVACFLLYIVLLRILLQNNVLSPVPWPIEFVLYHRLAVTVSLHSPLLLPSFPRSFLYLLFSHRHFFTLQ